MVVFNSCLCDKNGYINDKSAPQIYDMLQLFLSILNPTHLSVWTDEGGDADYTSISKELSNLRYSPNVLLAILRWKAKVFIQPGPDVVTVENVGGDAPWY